MLKKIEKRLPPKPGVYVFKDKNNQILYIGKAKNLKTRVSSYFQKKDDLLQSPDYLTSLSKTRYSSLEVREAKADYQARSKFHGFEVVFQLKVVEKMAELPKKIRNKIPKVIIQVIKNPGNPGLGYEESVVGKHKIIRCRIDLKHRIHFEPLEKNAKRLIVRDIGGHRLEGIGD